ncbi:hypothetical protein M569_05342, partial [Genlisea aurea]
DEEETPFDRTLRQLGLFLSVLGFKQSSLQSVMASWTWFLVVGVLFPLITLELSTCSGCETGQIQRFEIGIVAAQAFLAGSALLCLSHNLRKHGVKRFLFVDRYSGHEERFSTHYLGRISDSMGLFLLCFIPCVLLKVGREILRFVFVERQSPWHSFALLLAFTLSWSYVTSVIISASILFRLVCCLQIVHLDDYLKLLEREGSSVMELLQEHARLRYCLSKISHRFRIFLLAQLVIVTVVQVVFLFHTTGFSEINVINGGDFAVSTIVQVVGVVLCLNASAKISHRAQQIGAMASKWHAFVTASCSEDDSSISRAAPYEAGGGNSTRHNDSGSDLEPFFNLPPPPSTASYQKRLALVLYLQANPGGISVYGWTVDRSLINTIFCLELSLVTFVLSKTIVV